jgi:two-component system sensor histidine kinase CpxA
MIRHIYTKIFLWFWVVMIAVVTSVVLIAAVTGAQPLGRRWLTRTLDYYGNSAVDFYVYNGRDKLAQYLDDIERNSGIRATLIDPQSRDVLARGIPPGGKFLLEEARTTGDSQIRIAARWTGAAAIHRDDGLYILVMQINPLRNVLTPGVLATMLLRFAIALLCAGVLCWVLARHIAEPIRTLQVTAGRLAGGDLSVRAGPAIGPRHDELADLATDFDRMAEQIQALLAKQQELFADISHELRSPLARLGVSLELVRRGEMDGVERMQTDIDRLDDMIGQILTLTRLQGQTAHREAAIVNLRSIIESVAEDARFEGKEEGKSVEIIPGDAWSVKGDPGLLRSAIENVVRNAIRYTKPGSRVTIALRASTSAPPRFAEIIVSDNGEGVPPEALPRLFEPFYRVSPSRDRNTGGTGLGLSIAHRIVTLYSGSIAARNLPASGLEVIIRLPITA